MKRFFRNSIFQWFALALAILAVAGALLLISTLRQAEAAKWVAHTHEVLEQTENVVSRLSDTENGRRGFLLTSQDRYLAHYKTGVTRTLEAFESLRSLTKENPRQQAACDKLEPLIQKRLSILAESVESHSRNSTDREKQLSLTERGQEVMEGVRKQVKEMKEQEQALLQFREAAMQRNVVGTTIFAVIGSMAGLTFLSVSMVLFLKENAKRLQAEQDLQEANHKLERRVQERTAELAKALTSLQDNETSFSLLFANNPLPMWVFDQETLEIIAVNEVALAHYGYSREEFMSMKISDIRPQEDRRRLLEYLATDRPQLRFSGQWRHCLKDGRIIDVEITSHRLEFAGRTSVLVVAQDVTERKHLEKEIQRQNEELEFRVRARTGELEAANKELEAFSYSVSHDLRAPLRHVDGFVDLLRQDATCPLNDSGKRYLNIISDSARQMGALIDDLLAFSRIGRIEMRRSMVAMNALVEEVIQEMSRDLSGRKVRWKIEAISNAEGDRAMLKQVWVNLLSNAVKYTRHRDEAIIKIQCTKKSIDELEYSVQDNGTGFEMQYAGKLFGVFQRLHRAEEFEGTGIGLANVKRIVTRHGGRVWAEGKPNEGATFTFTIPIATKALYEPPEKNPPGGG